MVRRRSVASGRDAITADRRSQHHRIAHCALVELPEREERLRSVKQAIAILGAVLLAAACSSSHHSSALRPSTSSRGVPTTPGAESACSTRGGLMPVEVTLRMVGGAPPGVNKLVAGTVVAVSDSGARCEVSVGDKNATRIALSLGRYTVIGRSPSFGDGKYECSAAQQLTVSERPPGSHGPPALVTVMCPVR